MDDALALYRGDFLHGLFVSDTGPELERLFDEERTRLRAMAREAAWALAEARRAAGDRVHAAEFARRAASLASDSEAELSRLITFLDESGDRAGALAAYDDFARRLRAEYEAEPSPETQALIREVRSRTLPSATAHVTPRRAASARAVPNVDHEPAVPRRMEQRQRPLRAFSSLAVVGLLALSGYLVAFANRRPAASRVTTAVPPAQGIAGDTAQPILADSMTAARRSTDPEASNHYVRARYWWGRRGRQNLLKAVGTFQQALDADPTFSLAYSGMGDAYAQLGYGGYLRPEDAFPKAKAAARKALELDSTLAEPHATLGYVAMYYDWDWTTAEREYELALARNPSYSTAHEWYGLFLAGMGRFAEAQAEGRRAMELEPLSIAVAATAGWVLHYSGKQADAERQLRIALRTDSTFAVGHLYLGRVLQFNGQLDSALAHFEAMGPLRTWVPTIAGEAYVYAQQGRRDRALAILQRLDSLSRTEYVTAYAVALVHAALGQRDSAFAWLDRAVAERTHWVFWLNRDRRWDPIRADPRFRRLTTRVGLPD
jgi:tetratricopeptide (TPR) repeat protein